MMPILFLGAAMPPSPLFQALLARGELVLLGDPTQCGEWHRQYGDQLLVVLSMDVHTAIAPLAQRLRRYGWAWIAWNSADDPALNHAAYDAGALIVLPAQMSAAMLLKALDVVRKGVPAPAHPVAASAYQQHYARGTIIRLDTDAVLIVEDGVVMQTMIHADGNEVLLGLYGPGQLLVGHPEDNCFIQLQAHTATVVLVQSWPMAASSPAFAERMRKRILLMEAWLAMQARPYLEQRVLGVLSLLAEQFGVQHTMGILVDVRLTHAQLAAAVGATRSTITRILSSFRDRRLLTTLGQGEQERFCLLQWEQSDHGSVYRDELAELARQLPDTLR